MHPTQKHFLRSKFVNKQFLRDKYVNDNFKLKYLDEWQQILRQKMTKNMQWYFRICHFFLLKLVNLEIWSSKISFVIGALSINYHWHNSILTLYFTFLINKNVNLIRLLEIAYGFTNLICKIYVCKGFRQSDNLVWNTSFSKFINPSWQRLKH